jgi:acetylglutamate kinase
MASEGAMQVIKVGGNDLAAPGFIPALAEAVADLHTEMPCVLVHGGGRAITALMEKLGVEPVYVDGQRVTDEPALEAAEMVLSGSINKALTLALIEAGIDALGMSGVDRSLLRVEPWGGNMGLVGRIVAVRTEVLHALAAEGVLPVISPISAGPDGRYNVNADHAAGAIAGALEVDRAVFVSNVPGVNTGEGVAEQLTAAQVEELIAAGVIAGGMIPKVRAAIDALNQGAQQAVITDLAGLHAGTGTAIHEAKELGGMQSMLAR